MLDVQMTNNVAEAPSENPTDRQRHFLAVFFLSFMWGMFGVDRFYLGKTATGVLKLLTFGGFGLWVVIDLALILSGTMTDKQGNPMREFQRYKAFAVKTVVIFAVATGVLVLITGAAAIYIIGEFVNTMLEQGTGGLQNLMPGGSPTDMQDFESMQL